MAVPSLQMSAVVESKDITQRYRGKQNQHFHGSQILLLNPEPQLLWLTLGVCSASASGAIVLCDWSQLAPICSSAPSEGITSLLCVLPSTALTKVRMHLGPNCLHSRWDEEARAGGGRLQASSRPGDTGMMVPLRSSRETERQRSWSEAENLKPCCHTRKRAPPGTDRLLPTKHAHRTGLPPSQRSRERGGCRSEGKLTWGVPWVLFPKATGEHPRLLSACSPVPGVNKDVFHTYLGLTGCQDKEHIATGQMGVPGCVLSPLPSFPALTSSSSSCPKPSF